MIEAYFFLIIAFTKLKNKIENKIDITIFISDLRVSNDLKIQQKYLNCLQWINTIVIALSLLNDEAQALSKH